MILFSVEGLHFLIIIIIIIFFCFKRFFKKKIIKNHLFINEFIKFLFFFFTFFSLIRFENNFNKKKINFVHTLAKLRLTIQKM